MPPAVLYESGSNRPCLPARLAAARTAAVAAVAAAAAEATAAARGLRTRFIDGQIAAAHVVVVELLNRGLRRFVGRHFHECEPARAAGGLVAHEVHAFDLTGVGEQR